MGFFSKIGKSIGKVAKGVGKTVGKVVKTVAPVASVIPGVGGLVSAAGSIVGEVLDPTKQAKIAEAVSDQGVVKLDKIEETIIDQNPSIDAGTLTAATAAMTNQALRSAPAAKIDDSNSLTKVDTMTKIIQWVKSNFIIFGGAALGLLFILKGDKGRRRRYQYGR